MNKKRAIALAAATLVAGLVIGNMASAFAARSAEAPRSNQTQTQAACEGTGARIGPMMRDAGGRLSDVVASLTGLSADDVATKRADGESIADVGASAGVSSDEIVTAALEVRTAALDEMVAAGSITQEQADVMIDRMTDRLAERVTSTDTSANGCGNGGGRGFGGGRGQGSGACGACPNAQ
ncbi:MAG: YckD family protein [Coriobacteriia bacterium]|nr:YckD family protein [Coriobacteriia bacterium]